MTTAHLIFILAALVVGGSVYWTSLKGAPWAPSPMKIVRKMLRMAEVGPGDLVYDLGCGDGRLIIAAAREYGARAVGVELDPFRYVWCQILITVLGLRKRVRIVFGDIFHQDYSDADVITCFLMQDTNNRLEKKLKSELGAGARIVSNTFDFTDSNLVRRDGLVRLYVM